MNVITHSPVQSVSQRTSTFARKSARSSRRSFREIIIVRSESILFARKRARPRTLSMNGVGTPMMYQGNKAKIDFGGKVLLGDLHWKTALRLVTTLLVAMA